MKAGSIRSWLWGTGLALGAFFALPVLAAGAANFIFNGAGQTVASSATVIEQEAIRGTGLTWAVADSGYVARATAAANATLYSQSGNAIRVAGTAATRVAANDMALSAVRGLRAGLPGLIASVALDAALQLAKEHWDALQQSMIYNPDAVAGTGPPACTTMYKIPGQPDGDFNCDPTQAYNAWAARQGTPLQQARAISCTPGSCVVQGYVNGDINRPVTETDAVDFATRPGVATAGPLQCPNGVVYDIATGCAQAVSDDDAAGHLGPDINAGNGPAIGQDITNDGGTVNGSELPKVNLNPSSGPTTTTSNPNTSPATQTQTHTDAIPNCVANACAVSLQTTQVQLDPNGNPLPNSSPKVTTTTPSTASGNPQDQQQPCGDTPATACFINEAGTPAATTPLPNSNAADAPTTARLNALPSVVDSSNKDVSLPDVLSAPVAMSCTPFALPAGMGNIDPCGPMEDVRAVMDYIWALAAFWIIIGMVKRTVDAT